MDEHRYFGFVTVIGESLGEPGYVHDDLGISPVIAGELISQSQANAVYIPAVEPKFLVPHRDACLKTELLEKMSYPFFQPGVEPFVCLTYYEFPGWMFEGDNFWEEADELMETLVRWYAEQGVRYFIFENEPNMYGQENWAEEYMEHLKHFHNVVRSVSSKLSIIAGNLSETAGEPGGAWEELYQLGFRDYSDVVGYHPYSDEPHNGIDIEDAAKSHGIMDKYGDGDKPMFFGEGWGSKRLIRQIPRSADEPVSKEEIRILREFLVNGYRSMMTKTETWDPGWFMGALFFTLNENIGKMHWKERVRQQDNDGDGIPDTWYIDKVWLGTDTPCIDPEFYNGGLVTMRGESKGELLELFPGSMEVSL